MQEHFHFTTNQAKIQKQYAAILSIVITQLSYIEAHLERRNRHLLKQNDEVIIAVHTTWKVVWLHVRTSVASLCRWKLIHGRVIP